MSGLPSLEGRAAVITGGGRGVGAAVARQLASAGASILVCARTEAEVERVASDLRDEGFAAHAATCDVADPSSVDCLARTARDTLGSIDILVNNAGISLGAPIHQTTYEDWMRVMAVNATGAFLCLKAFLPGMIDRGWGRVVNVASIAGISGDRFISAYAASKHALVGLTRAAAAEVAARGVTVNAVCPGYLRTDMTRDNLARMAEATGRPEPDVLERLVQRTPQKRLIEADEVAAAVLFLCTEGARSITGESIVIDGGELRR